MVIDKNLTLADAYRILGLLWTNKTGNVTVFAFFATSQFYTLGFAWEVSKLTANTSVVNAGNWSVPPPPPPWWQLFWNMIAGWPEVVWKLVVAVKVFFRLQGARVIWLDLLGPPDEVIGSLFQGPSRPFPRRTPHGARL